MKNLIFYFCCVGLVAPVDGNALTMEGYIQMREEMTTDKVMEAMHKTYLFGIRDTVGMIFHLNDNRLDLGNFGAACLPSEETNSTEMVEHILVSTIAEARKDGWMDGPEGLKSMSGGGVVVAGYARLFPCN